MNADGALAKRVTQRRGLAASANELYSAIVVRSFIWSRRMNLPIDLKCNSPCPYLCYWELYMNCVTCTDRNQPLQEPRSWSKSPSKTAVSTILSQIFDEFRQTLVNLAMCSLKFAWKCGILWKLTWFLIQFCQLRFCKIMQTLCRRYGTPPLHIQFSSTFRAIGRICYRVRVVSARVSIRSVSV